MKKWQKIVIWCLFSLILAWVVLWAAWFLYITISNPDNREPQTLVQNIMRLVFYAIFLLFPIFTLKHRRRTAIGFGIAFSVLLLILLSPLGFVWTNLGNPASPTIDTAFFIFDACAMFLLLPITIFSIVLIYRNRPVKAV